MPKGRGRDQLGPMERLVKIAAYLRHAGDQGAPALKLIEVAGFAGADPLRLLTRELDHLKDQGWQIDTISGAGEHARYRMSTVDNRLRVALTPGQQRALQRAALLADRDDLVRRLGLPEAERPPSLGADLPLTGHDETLATVVRAVRFASLLRYRYNGSARVVHPQSVRTQHGKWYLLGREEGATDLKVYVVSRMSEVALDEARTATREPEARHPGLHPMSWEIDPPVTVTLRSATEHAPDVRRWLGAPETETAAGGTAEFTYRVTHRAALLDRLYQLGLRVTLVGPDEMRAELLAELESMAGATP